MKKVWKLVKKVVSYPLKAWYMLTDYLRYYKAVQVADEAHEKDSDRYYVMPSMDKKLIIVDRKNFRLLKRKGYINKNATINTMLDECFYYTASMQSQQMAEDDRKNRYKEYKQWCRAMRLIDHYIGSKTEC